MSVSKYTWLSNCGTTRVTYDKYAITFVFLFLFSVKLPVVDSRRALKDKRVGFGKNIELNCRIKRSTFPLPLFQWYKDGLKIRSFRGLSIRTGK